MTIQHLSIAIKDHFSSFKIQLFRKFLTNALAYRQISLCHIIINLKREVDD